MKIVIDISEDVYTRLFDNGIQDNEIEVDDVCEMARAIRKGTPLPKGHGRLIDADALELLEQTDGDLISRTELLNKIWKNEYGIDYDGVNPLNIRHIDIIEQMPSAEKNAEVRPMQEELTEELKDEIKQTLIQSNKDLSYALEDYDRGWLGGNLEIVRILEKHYGKFIDDDEI